MNPVDKRAYREIRQRRKKRLVVGFIIVAFVRIDWGKEHVCHCVQSMNTGKVSNNPIQSPTGMQGGNEHPGMPHRPRGLRLGERGIAVGEVEHGAVARPHGDGTPNPRRSISAPNPTEEKKAFPRSWIVSSFRFRKTNRCHDKVHRKTRRFLETVDRMAFCREVDGGEVFWNAPPFCGWLVLTHIHMASRSSPPESRRFPIPKVWLWNSRKTF
jgi:hypothetical protein